jgi:hypothetical protein
MTDRFSQPNSVKDYVDKAAAWDAVAKKNEQITTLVKALEDLVFTISTTAIKPGWPLQYLERDVQQARATLAAVKDQS